MEPRINRKHIRWRGRGCNLLPMCQRLEDEIGNALLLIILITSFCSCYSGFYSETDTKRKEMNPRLKVRGCKGENVSFSMYLHDAQRSSTLTAVHPECSSMNSIIGDSFIAATEAQRGGGLRPPPAPLLAPGRRHQVRHRRRSERHDEALSRAGTWAHGCVCDSCKVKRVV